MLSENDIAPDFELPDRGGLMQTLDSLAQGTPLLLAFYRVSCPVCQYAFPFLDRLAQGAIRVAGISQDDAGGVAEFYQELGLTAVPTVIERRGWAVGAAYRITNVPSFFVVEPGTRAISLAVTGFSKAAFEALGARAGVEPWAPDQLIPAFRPG